MQMYTCAHRQQMASEREVGCYSARHPPIYNETDLSPDQAVNFVENDRRQDTHFRIHSIFRYPASDGHNVLLIHGLNDGREGYLLLCRGWICPYVLNLSETEFAAELKWT